MPCTVKPKKFIFTEAKCDFQIKRQPQISIAAYPSKLTVSRDDVSSVWILSTTARDSFASFDSVCAVSSLTSTDSCC